MTFRYLRCFQPLADEIYNVLPIISENAIALVIVDSQLASQGDGNDQAQLANKFFNTVRAFGCTSLIIDHVTKESMNFNSESLSPYGSIVKYNRLRSVFNLEKTQNEGEDTIDLCMRHTKNNEGKLLPRQGIRIKFNNFGDDLESVVFEKFNVADNPKMAEKLPVRDQLINALRNGRRAMTVEELGEVTAA